MRMCLSMNRLRWYSRPELNRDERFRKPLLYPFELREQHVKLKFHSFHSLWAGERERQAVSGLGENGCEQVNGKPLSGRGRGINRAIWTFKQVRAEPNPRPSARGNSNRSRVGYPSSASPWPEIR